METFLEFRGQNEIEFMERFSSKESCLIYLSHHKWANGFTCPVCGCEEEYFCNIPYHKRCKKCLHLDSPTANTLFHKVIATANRFGLTKAFLIVFKMSATTKSVSAEQLAKNVGVNRKTALLFQHKVRLAMKSSENYPMQGDVEVDEAFMGNKKMVNIEVVATKQSSKLWLLLRNQVIMVLKECML